MAADNVKDKKALARDDVWYYSDLAYIPTDLKESKLWMAKSLFYAKRTNVKFLDDFKAQEYRKTDKGELNRQEFVNLVDPPTSMDTGGKADYFAADFKAMPVDAHLDNIIEASIRRIPLNLVCKIADPVAKLQEQKEKEKIIYQNIVRSIINEVNKDIGLPPITESQDPYKYIQSFTSKGKDPNKVIDEVGSVMDQIRSRIKDNDGFRIYQQYLYKNGIEIAFEAGIQYYLLNQNKWQAKWGNLFFNDIKHFNKFCGEWVIDTTTGRGMVKYIDPARLYTSPFSEKNGDDILYYFHEHTETFAEFERLVGSEMSDEDKAAVLQLQKERGGYNSTYQDNVSVNNSQITIGRFAVCTQEANAFSEKLINGELKGYIDKPLDWKPEKEDEGSKTVKAYNVWYTCYYIPLTQLTYSNNATVDWEQQSKFIFKIEKVMDMYRYGTDMRYAKPPLVIRKDDNKLSFTDIKQAFMPKIHHQWHKFQNYSTQDFAATVFDIGLVQSMLNAVDEANKDAFNGEGKTTGKNADAVINSWKMLRQAGQAPLNFRDKNNQPIIDPSKLIFNVGNDLLKKAMDCLLTISELYNQMTQALAINNVREGLDPKARTPLGGIQKALEASNNGSWAIEFSYSECVISFAERVVQHIHVLCQEKSAYNYDKRWKELNDVLGMANGATLESIEKINLSNIGLTVVNEDTSAKKELLITLATNMLSNKEINESTLGLILDLENWKLMIVILALAAKDKREQDMADAETAHQRQMELGQQQLQIAQAVQQAKSQSKVGEIQAQTQSEAALQQQLNELKTQSQSILMEQRKMSKMQENQQKLEISKEQERHKKNLETSSATVQ